MARKLSDEVEATEEVRRLRNEFKHYLRMKVSTSSEVFSHEGHSMNSFRRKSHRKLR